MIYRYKVRWCFEEETPISEGIGAAESFGKAMDNIIDLFGDDKLWDVNIEWLGDNMEIDFEDLLDALTPSKDHSTELGEQMILALEELISVKEEIENEGLEAND